MNYTLKNGAKIEGSIEQILNICKTMGETVDLKQIDLKENLKGFYLSEKNGLVDISLMHDTYLKNALLKLTKKHFEELGSSIKTLSNKEFMNKFIELTENTKVIELFNELSKR